MAAMPGWSCFNSIENKSWKPLSRVKFIQNLWQTSKVTAYPQTSIPRTIVQPCAISPLVFLWVFRHTIRVVRWRTRDLGTRCSNGN